MALTTNITVNLTTAAVPQIAEIFHKTVMKYRGIGVPTSEYTVSCGKIHPEFYSMIMNKMGETYIITVQTEAGRLAFEKDEAEQLAKDMR